MFSVYRVRSLAIRVWSEWIGGFGVLGVGFRRCRKQRLVLWGLEGGFMASSWERLRLLWQLLWFLAWACWASMV